MSQIEPAPKPRRPINLTVSILFILMGSMVVAIAMGFLGTDRSGVNAPPWVLTIFGSIFVLVGIWTMIQNLIGSDHPMEGWRGWINFGFALLLMTGISVICLWMAFGAGERLFVQEMRSGFSPPAKSAGVTLGRIFFGFFGVLMSLATIYYAIRQPRSILRRPASRDANPAEIELPDRRE